MDSPQHHSKDGFEWLRIGSSEAYVSKVTDTRVPWHKMWNTNWSRKPET